LNVATPPVRFSQLALAVLNVPVSSNDPEREFTTRLTPVKFSPAALGAAEAAEAGAADGAADVPPELAAGLAPEVPQAARNAAARGAVAPAFSNWRRLIGSCDRSPARASCFST
jgi:hypothetical protein